MKKPLSKNCHSVLRGLKHLRSVRICVITPALLSWKLCFVFSCPFARKMQRAKVICGVFIKSSSLWSSLYTSLWTIAPAQPLGYKVVCVGSEYIQLVLAWYLFLSSTCLSDNTKPVEWAELEAAALWMAGAAKELVVGSGCYKLPNGKVSIECCTFLQTQLASLSLHSILMQACLPERWGSPESPAHTTLTWGMPEAPKMPRCLALHGHVSYSMWGELSWRKELVS